MPAGGQLTGGLAHGCNAPPMSVACSLALRRARIVQGRSNPADINRLARGMQDLARRTGDRHVIGDGQRAVEQLGRTSAV